VETMTIQKLADELGAARSMRDGYIADFESLFKSRPGLSLVRFSRQIMEHEEYVQILEFVVDMLDKAVDEDTTVAFAVGRGLARCWRTFDNGNAADPMQQVRGEAQQRAAVRFFELIGVKP
jgi:hypothetical protein